ncbi:hypothetical protein F0562_010391 [Nyssa sinensis]|uniref:Uncharacterized protein n=1 Tax=Nyssa sinensis TaxID=561372 RepID=A0A5J5A2G4_9ASTE|nr:hypothetical protein F0562_010391 [Nyssa sinensis]
MAAICTEGGTSTRLEAKKGSCAVCGIMELAIGAGSKGCSPFRLHPADAEAVVVIVSAAAVAVVAIAADAIVDAPLVVVAVAVAVPVGITAGGSRP